jgi:hypothetical protein
VKHYTCVVLVKELLKDDASRMLRAVMISQKSRTERRFRALSSSACAGYTAGFGGRLPDFLHAALTSMRAIVLHPSHVAGRVARYEFLKARVADCC